MVKIPQTALKLKYSSHLSKICVCVIGSIVLISPFLNYSSAQILSTPSFPKQTSIIKDVFRVSLILFGVDNETGNVFSFVKVNNVTSSKYFNASKEDSIDHNGIVETVLSVPNETIATGANFTVCNLVLKEVVMTCKWGLNIQGRTAIVQIALPTFKQK